MLLVTGGAGFIGSNIVAALNASGMSDIAVNDILGSGQKWRNLAQRRLAEFLPASDLLRWLQARKLERGPRADGRSARSRCRFAGRQGGREQQRPGRPVGEDR